MRFTAAALTLTQLARRADAAPQRRDLQEIDGRDQARKVDRAAIEAAKKCNIKYGPLKFLVLENEAVNAAVEDDIRHDLAKIGFTVERQTLSKKDINTARQAGDFHFSISETWGTPYDPASFASGWIDGKGGEGVYPTMVNFDAPSSREELLGMVQRVLSEEDPAVLSKRWEEIHNYYHEQAVMLPLWGKRIPTLLSSRLTSYQAGYQQFDYPVHKLVPLSGSTSVTIAPGARTGLFKTVGHLDAHTYGPNEFFSNNWVYEGLVAYGQGGQILPSLATSWTIEENSIGGDDYTFQLREGVAFHDGSPWNCAAAKLNFDHLLEGNLVDKHGWYGVPLYTEEWFCNGDGDMEFVLRTNAKHGPYLQELTFIRPIRMISPAAFVDGGADPTKANSCQLAWGVIDGDEFTENVTCAGIAGIYGTGPFIFESRDTVNFTNANGEADEYDNEVVFVANENYWGGAPAIERLVIQRFESSKDVKTALLSGELDVVWGSGVLSDADISEIENDPESDIHVFHSGDLQNVILLLNSGQPPFDDINVRKTVIHSINKAYIVEKELKGLQQVVDNVFPLEAPYCDVDLTPRWDYDFEKAILLSCAYDEDYQASLISPKNAEEGTSNNALAVGLGVGLGLGLLVVVGVAFTFFKRTKKLEQELEVQKLSGVST